MGSAELPAQDKTAAPKKTAAPAAGKAETQPAAVGTKGPAAGQKGSAAPAIPAKADAPPAAKK